METSVTFINSKRQQQTVTFRVWRRDELTQEQFSDLCGVCGAGAQSITKADWADDDDFDIEKQAAQQVGIQRGERFVIQAI